MSISKSSADTQALDVLFDEDVLRDRLMRAMSMSLIEKGYAQTTVADVVERARVSRRTFYEEFSDRGDCLLAICERSSEVAQSLIEAAADPGLPWLEQVENAIDVHIAFLTAEPRLTHAVLFEIHSLGERGQAVHREANHSITLEVIELAGRSRAAGAEIRELSYATAAAIVGGTYQLMQLMSWGPQTISVDEARQASIDLVLDATRPRD
jgi:AcrR family transcriptional regulator